MAFSPLKDTKFSGTETALNLTADAGGAYNLTAATTVTVPTITVGSSTQKAVNDTALATYVAAQLSTYATSAALDAAITGLDIKASVLVASTANVSLTGLTTIDGIAVSAGDRVLLKDQTAPAQNGIWIASASSWTRSTDFDSWAEIPGAIVAVERGSTNNDRMYLCSTDQGGTLNTNAITFTRYGGSTAADITNVPAGNIAATNVQAALNELDTEKLALTGGTVTGIVNLGSAAYILAQNGTSYAQYQFNGVSIGDSSIGANYGTILGNSSLQLGGNVSAADWIMQWTAANTMTVGSGDVIKMDTVAAGTNTTTIATTAFVQRDSRRKNVVAVADGSFPYNVTVATNLPSADVIICQQTAASRAVNLCAANALASGTVVTVKDGSAAGARTYPITVNRAGSDTIDGLTSDTIDTTSAAVDYMTDGTSKWYRI